MMNERMDSLTQKRKKWVESNKENNFEDGIKRLLTELYPDNAHFIYELLQNAEDTEASVVRFTLSHDSLDFEHNGKRLFSLSDVDAITSIGVSTKRDDPTSIGKFGVGFKAVFAYTNTPEIRSGDFHFRIHDLVVPEGLNQQWIKRTETLFTFPFDHPKKTAGQAVSEILEGLKALGDNTLLFLRHIKKIEYLLPDDSIGTQERVDHEGGRIEIRSLHPHRGETVTQWLRFEKTTSVKDDDGSLKDCCVAVAFNLFVDERKNRQADLCVAPLERGQVSIFFPAEKETSNLRFHIHAPFASTVARDSIRDCPSNQRLRDLLAELIVHSINDIRDKNMLDVRFLAVLPIPEDNLPIMYEPIRKAIVAAFRKDPLVPMRDGGHAKAEAILSGPARISDVIDDEALAFLLHKTPGKTLWAANAPQEKQREDRFLKSLEITDWGWAECVHCFDCLTYQDDERSRLERWISQRDDIWLMRLYALLGEACDKHDEHISIYNVRFVRAAVHNADVHAIPSEVYFPPEDVSHLPPNIHLVKPAVYLTGKSEAQKQFACSFLKRIGVRTFDIKALIEHKLVLYDQKALPQSKKSNIEDIRQFIAYWKTNPDSRSLFKEHKIFFADKSGASDRLFAGNELFLDSPYVETGLSELFSCLELTSLKSAVSPDYAGIKDFAAFGSALGMMQELEICEYRATAMQKHLFCKIGRSSSATIDKDFFINGLGWSRYGSDSYFGLFDFKAKSFPLSHAVWRIMCKAKPEVLEAVYLPNAKHAHASMRKSSVLVNMLSRAEWIPDKDGVFRKPEDLTKASLHPAFCYNNDNGWLTSIGFGRLELNKTEEYKTRNEMAHALEFESADIAAEWAEVAKRGVSAAAILAKYRRPELPEEAVTNPERRKQKNREKNEDAPLRESVIRERHIQLGLPPEILEAKAYLRAKYFNKDNQLVCQCCREEMPFKLSSGHHYFEAVQCLKGLKKHFHVNRLALCPVCAAKYQYARESNDEDIRSRIVQHQHEAIDNVSSVDIPVRLAGQDVLLHFVGTHWFDLKTLLEDNS
jgi:hypothetical protein